MTGPPLSPWYMSSPRLLSAQNWEGIRNSGSFIRSKPLLIAAELLNMLLQTSLDLWNRRSLCLKSYLMKYLTRTLISVRTSLSGSTGFLLNPGDHPCTSRPQFSIELVWGFSGKQISKTSSENNNGWKECKDERWVKNFNWDLLCLHKAMQHQNRSFCCCILDEFCSLLYF